MDVINCYLTGSESILETTEYDHLARRLVNDSCVFISRENFITLGLGCMPGHISEEKLEDNRIIRRSLSYFDNILLFLIIVSSKYIS